MKLSESGQKFGHLFEKLSLKAYPDPGSKDGRPWTIGYGHTGPEVVKGLVWTEAQADAAYIKDVASAESTVDRLVKAPLTQGQFDALVMLVFNIGETQFRTSTVLRKINAKDYDGAKAAFAMWNKNDGQVMRGLKRRRSGEQFLWDGLDGLAAYNAGQKAW